MFSNESYNKALKIFKKETTLNTEYIEFSGWIKSKYNVDILDVNFEYIKNPDLVPRLEIVFKDDADYNIFEPNLFSPDKSKVNQIKNYFIKNFDKANDYIDKLFVTFSNFKATYKDKVSVEISDRSLEEIVKKYKNKNIWKIYKSFWTITIFLQNEALKTNENMEKISQDITELYYEEIKKHDKLKIIGIDEIVPRFDSKELFDRNYKGNWFYYSRDH